MKLLGKNENFGQQLTIFGNIVRRFQHEKRRLRQRAIVGQDLELPRLGSLASWDGRGGVIM